MASSDPQSSHNRRQASVAALDNTLRESGIGYEGDMEFSAEQAKGRDDHSDDPTINENCHAESREQEK